MKAEAETRLVCLQTEKAQSQRLGGARSGSSAQNLQEPALPATGTADPGPSRSVWLACSRWAWGLFQLRQETQPVCGMAPTTCEHQLRFCSCSFYPGKRCPGR